MKRHFLWPLGLSVIFVFSASCVIAVVDNQEYGRFRPPKEFHENVPLAAGGTISLENWGGDILISGWEKDEVDIRADEISSRPFGRRIQFINKRDLEPRVRVEQEDDLIRIRTDESARDEEMTRVNYTLSVPHSVNLKEILNRNGDIHITDLYGRVFIDLQEGDVSIENFSGTMDASVSRGSVVAEILDFRDEDEVKILVREGDITLSLESGAEAWIEASAPRGDVDSDFDLKSHKGTRISLTALDGDIRIKKAT
jgi:hypothetical protein